MILVVKFFAIQNGIIYKCTVSSGIEVNNNLASLVGIYVEIVILEEGG